MSTPEGKVKMVVNRKLTEHFGSRCYRFMPVQNGMGAPGLDYHCCIDGLAVYIETKVEGKHMTPRQTVTRDTVEAAGGLVFEIHNAAEVETMIAQIELHLKFWPRKSLLSKPPETHDEKEADRHL